MSDIRFRTLSAAVLSLAAFSSAAGVAVVFLWWLVFCARDTCTGVSWKLFLPVAFLASGFPGLVLVLTGTSGGLLYAAKIFVLLLLAFWLGAVRRPGEFLDLGVWALGSRTGFDLGLTAELSLQFLAGISEDFTHMKTALAIKGTKLSPRTLAGLSAGLLMLSLSRANHTGDLLARRGYQSGGTYRPDFSPKVLDYLQFSLAMLCGIGAVVLYSISFF